ncbi:S-layer homology domain-containing protein [Candidatus Peregrinibacteria bacterium]|nr:S-layer homology domain-containing protein [Candidatus Peregrinibacteria bacterium]
MRQIIFSFICGLAFISPIVLAQSINFSDVNSSDWYYSSVNKLVEWGVIKNNPDGQFYPGQSVNRAELAVVLDRYNSYVLSQFDSNKLKEIKEVDAEKGKLTIVKDQLIEEEDKLIFTGLVQNQSQKEHKFIQVGIVIYNKNGAQIHTDKTFILPSRLKPKEEAIFVFSFSPFENYGKYEVEVIE